jgi:outer membrane protein TolC
MRASHLMSRACAAALLSVVTAGAQEVRIPSAAVLGPRDYAPAHVTSAALSLSDAVRLTLLHSPRIVSGAQAVDLAAGQLQEQRGAFDGYLIVAPSVEYALEPLVPNSADFQTSSGEAFSRTAKAFLPLADRFRTMAAELKPHAPECPRVYANLLASARDSQVSISGLCAIQPTTPDAGVIAARTGAAGERVAGILDSVHPPRELRTIAAQSSALIGIPSSLAGQYLLAGVPDTLQRGILGLDVTYDKPFRSGLLLEASLQFQASEDIYEGLPRDPALGGNPTPNRFWTTLPISLTLPLGKGRGSVAVAAAERAASFGLDAQREDLRHAATEEVYRTVLAYAALAAAQETVALLEESAARQAAIVDMTRQRVDAGEVPQMDLNWAEARAAAVKASLLGARSRLVTSRVGLMQSIGAAGVSVADMPSAADPLVVVLASIGGVPELVQIASTRRHDTQAMSQLLRASSAIDAGARSDLKRRVDLSVSGGLRNTYEVPPYPPPLGIFDPRGFWRSITGRVDPFIQASITVELPFGNNASRGREAQTRADVRSREVEIQDLTRSIHENIIGTTGAIALTAAAIDHAQAAVTAGDETLAGTMDRFKVGEVTLLDTLITEEQVTADRLEVLRLRQSYVSTLARLRFETGEIVRFVTDDAGAELMRFDPAGFVGKEPAAAGAERDNCPEQARAGLRARGARPACGGA